MKAYLEKWIARGEKSTIKILSHQHFHYHVYLRLFIKEGDRHWGRRGGKWKENARKRAVWNNGELKAVEKCHRGPAKAESRCYLNFGRKQKGIIGFNIIRNKESSFRVYLLTDMFVSIFLKASVVY